MPVIPDNACHRPIRRTRAQHAREQPTLAPPGAWNRETDEHRDSPYRVQPRRPSSGAAPLRVVGLRDHLCVDGCRLRRPAGRGLDVPSSQGAVGSVGSPAGRARVDRLDYRRAGRGAAVVPRRPVEPGEEHLPHGDGLEPGDDRGWIRRKLRAIDGCSQRRWPGRSRLRNRRHGAPGKPVSAANAQHRAWRVPRRRHVRIGAGRNAGRVHRRSLGLAGRVWRCRHSRALPRARVPHGRPRLQDGGAALGRRKQREAAHDGAGGDRRAPSAAHRAHDVHRRRIESSGGLDDVLLAAELLQPFLRSRTGPGGPQDGDRRAGRRRRRSPLEHGCRSFERAHAPGEAHRAGDRCGRDDRADDCGLRGSSSRDRCSLR